MSGVHVGEARAELPNFVLVAGLLLVQDVTFDAVVGGED